MLRYPEYCRDISTLHLPVIDLSVFTRLTKDTNRKRFFQVKQNH